jgi:hypothetical protein
VLTRTQGRARRRNSSRIAAAIIPRVLLRPPPSLILNPLLPRASTIDEKRRSSIDAVRLSECLIVDVGSLNRAFRSTFAAVSLLGRPASTCRRKRRSQPPDDRQQQQQPKRRRRQRCRAAAVRLPMSVGGCMSTGNK